METSTINTTITTTIAPHSATTNSNNNQHEHESKDEVDFVVVATNNNNNNDNNNHDHHIKQNINNNYEMNINKLNNSNMNSNKLPTENKQINNSSNNSNNINNNNNNNHRSNNNSSEIVPKSLILKETTQNQVPKNNKDSSSTSTTITTPAPNMQNNINNNSMKNNNNNKKKITVAEHQHQQQQQPTKKYTTKERLSLFSFSKKISQKSSLAATATTATTNNVSSSYNTNIGSYKDNTTETTTPASPNTTSYESENQSRNAALEKYKPLTLPCDIPAIPIGTPPRQHKFVKSTSISRLFGNTYNAKKFEKQEQKRLANDNKFNTYGGRRRASGPYLERFKRYAKEEGDAIDTNIEGVTVAAEARDLNAAGAADRTTTSNNNSNRNDLPHSAVERHHDDLGAKAMRTISRGLGKLWWKRTHSVDISTPDPEFKVSYLGNVLTGWAKGEGCVEKQLNTLWRNYTQNSKPDVIMRIKVCASGLKATTRQHGLTEYWANRITHCCAPKNYPRVFCWIYRHEGRKLKHELRCHAVLCSKEKIVQDICNTLKENLERALREFKREKILKQNARLSLANAAYDNPSLPRRKILLSVGGNNYRPPLERSKSAPKLMAIEEAIGEEDGDDIEETNEPEMKSCCQKDSLYPAMTLGRRRCRRGHSIRRTGGKARVSVSFDESAHKHAAGECCKHHDTKDMIIVEKLKTKNVDAVENSNDEQRNSYGSDESDDFDKLLKYNNYDTNVSLEHELLPYFEMQLHKNHSSLGDLTELKDEIEQPLSLMPTINSAPNADPEAEYIPTDVVDDDDDDQVIGLRRNGVCSDGEEDYLDADDMYFRQASILNMLHRNSMRKMANLSLSSGDESSSIETNASQYHHQLQSSISSNASSTGTAASASALESSGDTAAAAAKAAAQRKQKQLNADSDEGSISSGCETASTVTANQDDISLKYRQQSMQRTAAEVAATLDAAELMMSSSEHGRQLDEEPITADEIYQRLESRLQRRQNSDATTFSSSSSITLKMGSSSPTTSLSGGGGSGNDLVTANGSIVNARTRRQRRQSASTQRSSNADGDSDDSECSDESGYVEYQERDKQTLMRDRGEFLLNGEQLPSPTTVEVKATAKILQQQHQATKPQPPPKPMPRRLLLTTGSGSTSTAV